MRLGRIILFAALVLAIGLAIVYFLIRGAGGGTSVDVAATERALASVQVVVVSQDINRGEVISQEKLGIRSLPKDMVTEGSTFSSFVQVVGETSRIDLKAGTFLNNSMLVGGGDDVGMDTTFRGSDHAYLIPEGMVAFPVPINRFSSVAYGISRGDYVDVIVTMAFVDLDTQFQSVTPNQTAGVLSPGGQIILADPGPRNAGFFDLGLNSVVAQSGTGGALSPQGRAELDGLLDQVFYYVPAETQRPRIVSQRIFQNLAVLNVGTFPIYDDRGRQVQIVTETPPGLLPEDGPAVSGQTTTTATAAPPDIITLVMWPQDAVTLNYMLYTGAELTLALRGANSVNEPRTDTDAVTLQYLMDVYKIPLPVRLPYGTTPRVDELAPPVLENDFELVELPE